MPDQSRRRITDDRWSSVSVSKLWHLLKADTMAPSTLHLSTPRLRRRCYRFRLCRFEPLEPRQVLSAAIADLLASAGQAPGWLNIDFSRIHATSAPTGGFTPAQIREAYGFNNITLPGGKKADGTGTTIAIIDPGHDPTIVSDLHAFDLAFGIPDPPSFKIVSQFGSTNPANLPVTDPDTSLEIALDVEWAHAIAPGANILLVEVPDPFSPNSGGALDPTFMYVGNLYARTVPGVNVISNSWGGPEALNEMANDRIFTTPSGHGGIQWVFSAGDTGGPASYPSASPNVLSVGGTSLSINSRTNAYVGETVWNDLVGSGGGGQSAALVQDAGGNISSVFPIERAPNFQAGLGYTGRGTPDVSFNAVTFDIYSSVTFGSATPWGVVYGTSAGAPIWSALIAIADQGRKLQGKPSLSNVQSTIYKLPAADFHDITKGNNDLFGLGLGITGNAAKPGYDLASGRGTPIANLVVRDLIAANGTPIVTWTQTSITSQFLGLLIFSKPSLAASGSVGMGPVSAGAATSITVASSTAAPSSSPDRSGIGQYWSSGDAGNVSRNDSSVSRTNALLDFASECDDSNLFSRARRTRKIDAGGFEFAADKFFAEI